MLGTSLNIHSVFCINKNKHTPYRILSRSDRGSGALRFEVLAVEGAWCAPVSARVDAGRDDRLRWRVVGGTGAWVGRGEFTLILSGFSLFHRGNWKSRRSNWGSSHRFNGLPELSKLISDFRSAYGFAECEASSEAMWLKPL